jgi:NADPH-dependent 2,4-dienoyl-CoA reductase/sulfur reductase-like enzyme
MTGRHSASRSWSARWTARTSASAIRRDWGSILVSGLDLDRRLITIDGGEQLAFDGLIIATGARARRLPAQPDVASVRVLRTLEDAIAVRDGLRVSSSVIVVGAGFIGLEVASSARSIGCDVTVLEAARSAMIRVFPPDIGDLFAGLHEQDGTAVRCAAELVEIMVNEGRASGVRLRDGTTVPADLIVVGVGATPNDTWLRSSGLDVGDGVTCDRALRAAERAYACGDVARWTHPIYGSIRVEHWTTAVEHARVAAANLAADLLGHSTAPRAFADAIPYFWSDQCGVKFQLAGVAAGADQLHAIADGDRCAILFGRDGGLVATLTANWPRLLALCRRRIAARDSFGDAVSELPDDVRPPNAKLSSLLERLDSKGSL